MTAVTVTIDQFWPAFLDRVRTKVRRQQFETWFGHLGPKLVGPDQLVIRAPNQFIESWLKDNYLETIGDVAESLLGSRPRVEFVLDPSLAPELKAESESVTTAELARRQGFRLNEHYTFDNFVVGPTNRIPHAACLAIAESPGRTYNPLFLHGSVGLGKSHLLQATCHALLGRFPKYRIRYLSCEQFVNEFISAIQRNELFVFRERYRHVDALMIDDIQFLGRAERSQEEFFHTFNALYNSQKQIVLTSDVSPSDVSGLEERLASRFKSGLVSRLDPPHYETRVAILRKKAELRGIELPAEVIQFVAARITSNIRELEGAIIKISGHASLTNEKPGLELAKKALHEPTDVSRSVTIEDILKVTSDFFGVRVADLQSKKRHKSIAFPRQVCMHLARSLTNHSLEEIGGYFGGRDHTTVLYADTKIRDQAKADEQLQRTLGRITTELQRISAS